MVRNTRQRRAILQALAQKGRPLSPAEILELGQQHVPAATLLAATLDSGRVASFCGLSGLSPDSVHLARNVTRLVCTLPP